jgi:hypothetical protein
MKQKSGNVPDIYVVVLPEGAADLYQQVKQYVFTMVLPCTCACLLTVCPLSFSDCQVGVATQCLKAQKCFRAKPQYYANVMLKYVVSQFLPAVLTDPASGSMSSSEGSTPFRRHAPSPSFLTPKTPPLSSALTSSIPHLALRTSPASPQWLVISTQRTAGISPYRRCRRADRR